MPYFPYVPIIGIITKLFLAVYLFAYSPIAWAGAIIWILVGFLIFFVYSRGHLREKEIKEETRLVKEERKPTERPYEVLVPIANPIHTERLSKIGERIAKEKNGEVIVTTIVTVPEQTPLDEGHRYISKEQKEILKEVDEYIEDVPVRKITAVGHDVGKSITNLAYEKDVDLILLGWRGKRKRFSDYFLGSTIDYVVENAPCDVSVAKAMEEYKPEKILIPVAGGRNVELSESIAKSFAKKYDSEIILVNVFEKGEKKANNLLDKHKRHLIEEGLDKVENVAIREKKGVADDIIEYAEDRDVDMIVLGATEKGLIPSALFGNVPEEIGERFDKQVIMVKKHQRIKSYFNKIMRKIVGKF
ncbi:MAG: Nucleotide-binding protein UspA family [Candidatus Methanohalarchaeum thermophilum]|uniref:Nucleotide-binding protein UspA family n=1 Tax=Methanohalarchaeum thermophilum TaxID=1903181 RepID=A0A1Q6DS10_METT1|nr:MAG: Nucleotide-binding protein UspA family [Candidatus Methanohalarchaeum thermophilum]